MRCWMEVRDFLERWPHQDLPLNEFGTWLHLCHEYLNAREFISNPHNPWTMLAIVRTGGEEVIVGLFNKFSMRGYVAA